VFSSDTDSGFINTISLSSFLIRDGGLTIHRKRDSVVEHSSFTCPSCGKVFANPLRAQVHGSNQTRSYDACPYCLTDVAIISSNPGPEPNEPDSESGSIRERLERLREKAESTSLKSPETKTAGCKHSFGYLSMRSPKEMIPEECMICENIVPCMLKTMKG
jgi:hypothetical protein